MRNKATLRIPSLVSLLGGMLLLGGLLPFAQAEAKPGPVDVLKGMSDRVIEIVENDPQILDDKQRMRMVADEVVVPHVDFVLFSRWVLGKHWRVATSEQREIFITEFRELLINTYLNSITREDYQQQTVEYELVPSGDNPRKVVVDARVIQANGPLLRGKFRMYLGDSGWQVYDVVIEGVSLVATHRSSFSSIIRDKGINGLIRILEERNAERNAAGGTATAAGPAAGSASGPQ